MNNIAECEITQVCDESIIFVMNLLANELFIRVSFRNERVAAAGFLSGHRAQLHPTYRVSHTVSTFMRRRVNAGDGFNL